MYNAHYTELQAKKVIAKVLNEDVITVRQKQCIEMRYKYNYTYRQIGEEFSISCSRVQQDIDSAMRKIRNEINRIYSEGNEIESLGLPIRIYNVLKRHNLTHIDEIKMLTDKELLNYRGLGENGLRELRQTIEES